MKTNRKLSKLVLAMALPLVLVSAPKAQAYDLKQWSGSLCQAFFGAQEQYFDKTWNGIKNTTNVARWVSCGVTDDSYGSGAAYNTGAQGAFTYVTQGAGLTTTCYLSERGGVGQEIDTNTTPKVGTGLINVTTSSSTGLGGNRILACKLSAGATLNWIRIWENGSTDGNH